MAKFTDSAGREWIVSVTVGAIKRAREYADFDLLAATEKPALMEKLASDPCLLVNVIYAVCQRQAETAGVTDEQFGEALVGDFIEAASVALLQALTDFFPGPKRRLLQKAVEKLAELTALREHKAMQVLDDPDTILRISRAMDEQSNRQLDRALENLASRSSN